MTTVTESPNRRLRRQMGWSAMTSRRGVCVDDWFGLNTGDQVREKDGRHWGRVEGWTGMMVRVRWNGTNHESTIHRHDLTANEED